MCSAIAFLSEIHTRTFDDLHTHSVNADLPSPHTLKGDSEFSFKRDDVCEPAAVPVARRRPLSTINLLTRTFAVVGGRFCSFEFVL